MSTTKISVTGPLDMSSLSEEASTEFNRAVHLGSFRPTQDDLDRFYMGLVAGDIPEDVSKRYPQPTWKEGGDRNSVSTTSDDGKSRLQEMIQNMAVSRRTRLGLLHLSVELSWKLNSKTHPTNIRCARYSDEPCACWQEAMRGGDKASFIRSMLINNRFSAMVGAMSILLIRTDACAAALAEVEPCGDLIALSPEVFVELSDPQGLDLKELIRAGILQKDAKISDVLSTYTPFMLTALVGADDTHHCEQFLRHMTQHMHGGTVGESESSPAIRKSIEKLLEPATNGMLHHGRSYAPISRTAEKLAELSGRLLSPTDPRPLAMVLIMGVRLFYSGILDEAEATKEIQSLMDWYQVNELDSWINQKV